MIKNSFRSIFKTGIYIATAILVGVTVTYAGNLTPPGLPSVQMYTLGDIYTKLTANTDAGTHTISTSTSPASTFNTLTEIYNAIPTIDATKILTGTSYLGVSGTIPVAAGNTAVASSSAQGTSLVLAVSQGYYSGASSVTVSTSSANFVAANIKSGTNLFGVTGTALGAQLLKTRQVVCYDASGATISCAGTGQDGELQNGATHSYTDNGEATSTITDNATGLVWQKCVSGLSGTNCGTGSAAQVTWANALTYCNSNTAQLPGSGWRLPNAMELHSLVDYSKTSNPMINTVYFPATPGLNTTWSSTSVSTSLSGAYGVAFGSGGITSAAKGAPLGHIRCVRG